MPNGVVDEPGEDEGAFWARTSTNNQLRAFTGADGNSYGQFRDDIDRDGDIDLTVSKIYPQVNAGEFEVDMTLAAEPTGLRRGQTMQVRLTLSDNTDALLIPSGSFYQETGGNWLFVVSADGSEAVKRNVRLGRRNTDFIEVLDGLDPGERVITSPYTSYSNMDRLALDEG